MPEWRDTLFKGRPKIGLDFFNAPRQRGNRTKCLVHSMGYGLCVDVQKSGTTQIQNVLDKGYNLDGNYTFVYNGENITVALKNGLVETAFGDCRYSYEQLLELLE